MRLILFALQRRLHSLSAFCVIRTTVGRCHETHSCTLHRHMLRKGRFRQSGRPAPLQLGLQMALTARSPRLRPDSLVLTRPLTGRGSLLRGESQRQLATETHDMLAVMKCQDGAFACDVHWFIRLTAPVQDDLHA